MKDPSWLDLIHAVRALRDACRISDGEACAALIKACSSGVRSRKRPWPDDEPNPIYDNWALPMSTSVWHGASIDLEHAWLITADDSIVRASIEINADDLHYWIKHHATVSKESRAFGKRPRVITLLTEMFRDGRVPDPAHCPRKTLRADLLKQDPSLSPLDDQTLKNSIEEYNANR
jgi:hypothetical protein